MPYSIMDEFDDLFGSTDTKETVDNNSVSEPEDGAQTVFDPSEELLNEDL